MDLCSKKGVRAVLKKYDVRPLKQLGQNFLIDKSVLRKIVRAAELESGDVVLEIGPGIGTLTQALARAICFPARRALRGGRIIAVEKDTKMVEILRETLKEFKNVQIVQGDVLGSNFQFSISLDGAKRQTPRRVAFQSIFNFQFSNKYKIVANLPYNIASAVIRKFLEAKNPPQEMILMIQKEVAQRICAQPPKMSLLAVSVQFYSEPKIISYVSKKSFYPSPKVDSAILKIVPRQFRVPFPRQFREQFFRIAKAGFSQPRKQLINNLSKSLKKDKQDIKTWLLKNKTQPSQRAETLSVDNWKKLTKSFN